MSSNVNDASFGETFGPDGSSDFSMNYEETGDWSDTWDQVTITDASGAVIYTDSFPSQIVSGIPNIYRAPIAVPIGGGYTWSTIGTKPGATYQQVVVTMAASHNGC